MQIKWMVEIDGFCRKVLEKHWPDVLKFGDVHDIREGQLEAVDLICGGFPCQPVSVAGQRRGADDERWLWPQFRRVCAMVRPRWVLVENVPGLLSADAGRLMGGILRDLAALGYDAEWDCIPAAAVGAPHLRYRVFIVAHAEGPGLEGAKPARKTLADGCPTKRSGTLADAGGGRCGQVSVEPSDDEARGGAEARGTADGTIRRGVSGVFARTGGTLAGIEQFCRTVGRAQWAVEPDVGRVASRVSARVDRLRGLGNSVVPQVAEWVGRRILATREKG